MRALLVENAGGGLRWVNRRLRRLLCRASLNYILRICPVVVDDRLHEPDTQNGCCKLFTSNQYKSKPPLCWEPRTGHRMERYEKVQPRLLALLYLSLIHISEPTRLGMIS